MEDFTFPEGQQKFNMENPYHVETVIPEAVVVDTDKSISTKISPKKPIAPVSKLLNRLLLCCFAICYLWATSLQICVKIVNIFITLPSYTKVKKQCTDAYQTVEIERMRYRDCVNGGMDACDVMLTTAYQYELLRTKASVEANDVFLTSFTDLVSNYSSALSDSKLALNAWTSNGVMYTIPYKDQCVGSEKERVTDLLGDTSGSSSASLYSASQLYTELSDNRVAHLADYAVALNSYNAQYLNNKTKSLQRLAEGLVVDVTLPHIETLSMSFDPIYAVLDDVVDCVSLNNGTCSFGVGARDLFDDMNVYLSARLAGIQSIFVTIRSQLRSFQVVLTAALGAMDQFYDSVSGVQGIVAWVIKNTGGLFSLSSQLCGRASPNWCDFSPTDWFMSAPDIPDMPAMPSLADADEIWDSVKGVVDVARDSIASAADQLEDNLHVMVAALESAIAQADFTPDDYHPPAYPTSSNYSTEREQQASSSSSFLTAVQNIINSAQNANTSYFDSNPYSRVNVTTSSLSSSTLSSFSSSWTDFSFGGVDVTALLASITTIQGLLYFFDYMYRIFQSVRTFSKFWARGVLKLPGADNRVKKDEQRGWKFVTYVSYALQILPFVWLQLLISIFVVALILWSIAGVLMPEYYGYMAVCVDRTDNSTFVSRTLDAVAYNYASMDGNADVATGIVQYNAQLVGYCAINALSSSETYNSLVSSMLTQNQTLQSELTKIAAVKSCVDMNAIDTFFATACCGQSGYYAAYWSSLVGTAACETSTYECPVSNAMTGAKYLPPGLYLNASQTLSTNGSALLQFVSTGEGVTTLSNYMGEVQDSVFQCNVLPACELKCAGPDPNLVHLATKGCSCMAEWYFNGYVLQISIAILTYVLMNLSRGIVMGGLLKIWWKSLAPKIFEVTANCDGQGRILHARRARTVAHGTRISSGRLVNEKDRRRKEMAGVQVVADAVCVDEDGSEDSATVSSRGSSSSGKSNREPDQTDVLSDDDDSADDDSDKERPLSDLALHERDMARQLSARMRAFVRSGYIQVLLGLLLNAPWLALVYLTQQDMSYNGEAR